jgi:hypothetical protein
MAKTFRSWDVDQGWLLPPSVHEFVPPGHLAHFVRDTVREALDLSAILSTYTEERGFPPYHPGMMVALLLYGYSRGLYSSRQLARACEERVDVMAVTGLNRPDFRTISDFRKRHLVAPSSLFVDLRRFRREHGGWLCGLSLELSWADEIECRMASDWIVEPVDVAGNGIPGFSPGLESSTPNEFSFQRLEEGLDNGIVEAVPLARHRDQDAMLPQLRLVGCRAILATAVRMVGQTLPGLPDRQSLAQCLKRQLFVESVTDGPSHNAAGEEIKDHCQVQPPLCGPDVGDVGIPLLIRALS